MLYNNSIGIDIGRENISIVWLQSRLRGFVLMEQKKIPLMPGEEQQPMDKYGHIAALINSFIVNHNITSPAVYLAISDKRVILREVKFPLSVKKNFRDTISFELEKYVPFSKKQIYYDCQIVDENKQKNQLVILLIVIKKEDLDPWLQMIKLVDSGVSGLEVTSTALANGLAGQEFPSTFTAFAFIHHQENRQSVYLIHNRKLLAARDISDPAAGAEELLAPEIKTARINNLLPDGTLPVIVNQEDDLFKQVPEKKGKLTVQQLKLTESLSSTDYLAAFGLAIQGQQKMPGQINFVPELLRKKPDRTTSHIMYGLIGLNLLLLLVWLGAGMVRHKVTAANYNKEISRLKKIVHDLPQLEKNVQGAEEKINILNSFQHNRPLTVDIVKELTRIIPASAWLDNFNLKDMTVEIEGKADSASDLIPLLESSPFFRDATFLSTISRTREGKEKFKIQLRLE